MSPGDVQLQPAAHRTPEALPIEAPSELLCAKLVSPAPATLRPHTHFSERTVVFLLAKPPGLGTQVSFCWELPTPLSLTFETQLRRPLLWESCLAFFPCLHLLRAHLPLPSALCCPLQVRVGSDLPRSQAKTLPPDSSAQAQWVRRGPQETLYIKHSAQHPADCELQINRSHYDE